MYGWLSDDRVWNEFFSYIFWFAVLLLFLFLFRGYVPYDFIFLILFFSH